MINVVLGTCLCTNGWNGKHCTLEGCPANCNGIDDHDDDDDHDYDDGDDGPTKSCWKLAHYL